MSKFQIICKNFKNTRSIQKRTFRKFFSLLLLGIFLGKVLRQLEDDGGKLDRLGTRPNDHADAITAPVSHDREFARSLSVSRPTIHRRRATIRRSPWHEVGHSCSAGVRRAVRPMAQRFAFGAHQLRTRRATGALDDPSRFARRASTRPASLLLSPPTGTASSQRRSRAYERYAVKTAECRCRQQCDTGAP